mmetsp:Transcript_14117/g.21450  ORF Transcript_14117/g.21450 Transcript_14117/m.21450 type:complete len:149 (+) Transcript_14117:2787-3233(+)
MVVNHMPIFKMVVDDLRVLKGCGAFGVTFHPRAGFDSTKTNQTAIGAHEHHGIVWFFHRKHMKLGAVKLSSPSINITNITGRKMLFDFIPKDVLWPIPSFLDKSGGIEPTLGQLDRVRRSNNPTVLPRELNAGCLLSLGSSFPFTSST